MESTVMPSYKKLFSEGNKILKENRRIVITVPAVETVDGGRYKIDMKSIASKFGYKPVSIYGEKFIAEKSDQNLQLFSDKYSLFDDKSEFIRREFHVFEKRS